MRHFARLFLALSVILVCGDPSGQAALAQSSSADAQLKNSDVIGMVRAGLSQDVVITAIRQAKRRTFDLSPSGLIALKNARVPDVVIAVMQSTDKRSTAPAAKGVTGLSRERAAELIQKHHRLPAAQLVTIGRHIMKSWGDPDRSGSFMPAITLCVVNQPGETYDAMNPKFMQWKERGLLHVVQTEEHQDKCNYLWADVRLTDEGWKYLLNRAENPERPGIFNKGAFTFKLKTCDLVFGEVTGIVINDQFKMAEVEYTTRYSNLTPFALNINSSPRKGTATFILYDDGWRIKDR